MNQHQRHPCIHFVVARRPVIGLLLLLICLALLPAQGKEVGAVYIKNSGKDIMHLWVNGSYQGYLRPGETRYTVSDGFITNDSDRPTAAGGRTATKESHGGWEKNKSGPIELTFQYPGDKRQTNQFSADGGKDLVVGVNESTSKTSPEPPTELEVEGAPAIIKGSMPDLKIREGPDNRERGFDRILGQWAGGTVGVNGGNFRYELAKDGKLKIWPNSYASAPASSGGIVSGLEPVTWESFYKLGDFQYNPEAVVRDVARDTKVERLSQLPQLYKLTGTPLSKDRLFFDGDAILYYHHTAGVFYRLRKLK